MSIEELAEETTITTAREEQLSLTKQRKAIEHSVTLHRGAPSISEFKAIFRFLEEAGAPDEASIRIDTSDYSSRVIAKWRVEVSE